MRYTRGRSPSWWPARGQRGVVTVEAALALGALMLITVMICFVAAVGVAQVRCIDASRDVARALARGETREHSLGIGRKSAPEGATFSVTEDGSLVSVTVAAQVSGPGVVSGLGGVPVEATSVVEREPGSSS